MANRDRKLIDEEKEKAAIKWENDVLFILMPSVGLIAFILGLLGAILSLSSDNANYQKYKVSIAVFLIILAVLGAGGIAYGVVQFIKRRNNKLKKAPKEPSNEPAKE